MFCKYCGNQLVENAFFCSVCGSPVQDTLPVPATVSDGTADKQDLEDQNSVLINGILALALAASTPVSFIGIIFGIIARRKAGEYISRKGHSPARISVGKGLGKAGIIAGIAMSVFWFLYFILFVVIWGANFYYLF